MKTLTVFVVTVIFSIFTNVSAQTVASNDVPENSVTKVGDKNTEHYTLCNEVVGRDQAILVTVTVVNGEKTYTIYPKGFESIKNVYIYLHKNGEKKVATFGSSFTQKELDNFKSQYGYKTSKKLTINVTTEKGWFIYGTTYDRPFDEIK